MISVLMGPIAGFEPSVAACEIDARPRVRRHRCLGAIDVAQNLLHAASQFPGTLVDTEDVAEQLHRRQRVGEAAVDEDVRDSGLVLHSVRE